MKRYIRIDFEYDLNPSNYISHSYAVMDNIELSLKEDMPYIKVIFKRSCPTIEGLDELVKRR